MSADISGSSPLQLSAWELRDKVVAGDFTPLEVVDAHLQHAAQLGKELGAFQSIDAEGARSRASELQAARDAGDTPGPLFGVPIALKANMCLAGSEANCGSQILAGYKAPYTATFVQRALDAGAIPFGITEMDEFAMGSSGENSSYGCSRNPWDTTRTAGGSSSGSAVAVAAGLAPISLGSDTGGSVRQPAAFCGIYGLKPTYGRVSRYGLVAFGSSLDQVSPFARTVRDLEIMLEAISGHDVRDSTSLPLSAFQPERSDSQSDLKGLRIGVPQEYSGDGVDTGVREACDAALAQFEALGAELVPIQLPHTKYAISTYYVIATAEASSNLGRFDGSLYGKRDLGDGSLQGMFAATRDSGFGDEVKRRIMLGTYVLSAGYYDAWYGKALKVRTLLRQDFEQAFESVDVIAGPTAPTTPFALGERVSDPLAMYLSDIFTVPASLAGVPALSLPAGFANGLPVGLQLIGPTLSEGRLLRVAAAFEQATTHHSKQPELASKGGAV
ncbi:MAG: aspartyl-tRNA(Asn)/glutamyl-tRNA(Gln) amidotransferase subunit A [Planctomycetota bacterium]|jgi:aspartyl-tRNA(Asn)/glutamyl-tRNA(Gln) amidotransferase subunit A